MLELPIALVEFTHTDEHPTCLDPTCPCQPESHETGPVLAVGAMDQNTRSWLCDRGVQLIDAGPVTIVVLPRFAIVELSAKWWKYEISFYDESGVEIPPGVIADLDASDVRQSQMTLAKAA